jgi:hypothetical protein
MMDVTRKEACDIITSAIGKKPLEGLDLNRVILAANNDIQVRDFLLGLPKFFELSETIEFMKHMTDSAGEEQKAPFATVLTAFAYESGDIEAIKNSMQTMKTYAKDYNLGNLIEKIINAGWPAEQFAKMRDGLAIKVAEECYGANGSTCIGHTPEGYTNAKLVSE